MNAFAIAGVVSMLCAPLGAPFPVEEFAALDTRAPAPQKSTATRAAAATTPPSRNRFTLLCSF